MYPSITSTQNPKIKFALSLQKSSVRKKEGLFLVEGKREITLALKAGIRFHTLFYSSSIAGENPVETFPEKIVDDMPFIETSEEIFEKLAYRGSSDGLIAIAFQQQHTLQDISFKGVPMIIVVESVEKPGNLGGILRTADAGGVDAVLVCNGNTDIYNPNVVRSSLGSLFTNKVVSCSSSEAVSWLKKMNIKIFTTALSASRPYHQVDFTGPSAIVTGAEATGVTSIWEENSDSNIIIPMSGKVDSINVSVATSIVLYEALRQREFYGRKFP